MLGVKIQGIPRTKMSAINDTLSILNVEQLNNAVNLAHVLPLQPDGNQTNHMTLPIQNTNHAMSVSSSMPRITVSTTIPTNITSRSLPILMLNTASQGDQTLSHTNSSLRQITIPVLQEQNSHVVLPIQNVSPASFGTCLPVDHSTDISLQTLLSSPNQLNTLNLNQVVNHRINVDDGIQRQNINNNLQVISSVPISQPVATVNKHLQSSKLHQNETFLVNLKLPITIQNNQPIKINSMPQAQPTADISTNPIGQHLQLSLPELQNQPIGKNNISLLTTSNLNHLVTQASDDETCQNGNQMIGTQDPVAAASLFAGVTDELDGNSLIPSESQTNDFDTSLWCVECNTSHPLLCPVKGELQCIQDSPILSHARQTLPSILKIKSSTVTPNGDGVFAKVTIEARCQFGPLKGSILKNDLSTELDCPTQWKIFQGNDLHHCVDTRNENICNWMMFVRNARMSVEQNIVAYQWGQYIFFTTIRAIQPGEELLYWYSGNYAKKKGLKDKPEQCFWCSKCNRQFLSVLKLNSHMKYSHPDTSERKFKCTHCSRAFLCLTKLNVHEMTHSNVKPHKCNLCEKTFTDPSNLRMHQLIHTGVKKFKCPQCSKAFRQKAHLVTHMVTHTGEKKLKCPQCDKLFSRQSDVKTHMYFHTKEKQEKCSLCFKEFWNPQQYRKHMKSHAQEREYTCDYCKRGFNTLSHFKRHQESAVCRRKDISLPEGKSGRGRPKTKKRNGYNITHKLIAPAIDLSQASPLMETDCEENPRTTEATSAIDIEKSHTSSTWKKRSTRISQRRKQGKVMNFTDNGS
ncbi:uncharacterized protein [Antedon mediterranea]|uniref:uncharacterized protein isoform X2 n=1 Tax=Antedon mediterranea TaxID=105859 RepID=UPI003AF72A77